MSDGPATRYARAADGWSPLDWWKLEARALAAVPELRRALAFFAPSEAWRDLAKDTAGRWGCLLTLSHIASFTLPAVAAVGTLGWIFGRTGEVPLGFLGALAAVAAVIGGIGLRTDRREPAGTDPKVGRLLGGLHLVPALVGLIVGLLALAQDAATGAIGLAGFALDAVVGALHFVVHRGAADQGSRRWQRNLQRLQTASDALPADERARVYSDLQHAFDALEARGLVPADPLARARDVRIGLLGMTMAPRGDLDPSVPPSG